MAVTIRGGSDDLVEIETPEWSDEIDALDKPVTITIGQPDPSPGQNAYGLVVRMRYGPDWTDRAVWTVEVAPVDEDAPIPWPVHVGANGHTAVVHVDAPADEVHW